MVKKQVANLSKVANDAYVEAAPYLIDSEWVRGVVEAGLKRVNTFEALVALLEGERPKETDVNRQTDLKIYLAYLRKLGPKP
ncbi:MAG: hypothetical protein QXJ75_04000 [Candidatus Bathyarchaeia archaeon]